jgi:16S rRNA (guanine1207-N2)-methyltransferase
MSDPPVSTAVYGHPPEGLLDVPAGAAQLSPFVPGAQDIADLPDASLDSIAVLAPPGAIERRHVLAHALRALAPGGRFSVAAPKDRGGARLRKELEAFGCAPEEEARRHHRICILARPDAPAGLDTAIAEGGQRQLPDSGLWTQPGVFSWDRLDPASALLIDALPPLKGRGADFGCGIGWLALAALAASPAITELTLIDLDRRAVEAARRNIDDSRAGFIQHDLRQPVRRLDDLDFIVMNPPFHDAGHEDRSLGQAMIRIAAQALRRGGALWLTANRHLPYEAGLREFFSAATLRVDAGGYKVYEARK